MLFKMENLLKHFRQEISKEKVTDTFQSDTTGTDQKEDKARNKNTRQATVSISRKVHNQTELQSNSYHEDQQVLRDVDIFVVIDELWGVIEGRQVVMKPSSDLAKSV